MPIDSGERKFHQITDWAKVEEQGRLKNYLTNHFVSLFVQKNNDDVHFLLVLA